MTPDQPMVELPHARLAGGPRTLLVLEGLTLENKAPTGPALWLLRWAYKRYIRAFTVYQVGGGAVYRRAPPPATWPATMPGGRRGGSMARSTSSASRPEGRVPSTWPPTMASWLAGWC